MRDECAEGEPQGDDADCDGVDNDCDENIDESFVSAVITCGIGACRSEGATICENGQLVEQCNAGAGGGDDATCDGIDDDCDGRVDERFIGAVIGCGVGACSNESQTICQGRSGHRYMRARKWCPGSTFVMAPILTVMAKSMRTMWCVLQPADWCM